MRKSAWIIMLVIVLAGSSLVYAEGMKGGMMGKGMRHGKSMKMCPMMKTMTTRSVVATSDGGVVVVMGNKLTKYDKNLNVVKEVELKMDLEGMQKMMESMKGMCPMMGKGMAADADDTGTKTDSADPASEADHSSHH